jgi:hypothetical protein
VEEDRVRDLLHRHIAAGDQHLAQYLEQWNHFQPQPADTVAIDLSPITEGTMAEVAMTEIAA